MDPRIVAASKLLIEHDWGAVDAGTREYTAAELDAIADFSGPLEALQRAVFAGVQSVRGHWRRLGRRWNLSLARPQSAPMREVSRGAETPQEAALR